MTINTLANLIAFVESDNNPNAMRYEPTYTASQSNIALLVKAIGCSAWTSRIILSSSWGLYQIMGENLVNQGFRGWPGDYCSNSDVQLLHFNEFCESAKIAYTLDNVINDASMRLNFATHYNGPANAQAYADRMLAVYQAHS